MATVADLIARVEHWQTARDAFQQLAALPIADKRAAVYPAVVDLAARYWCVTDDPSKCGFELERIVEFVVAELAAEPELAAMVYAAMGKRVPKFRRHLFFTLARRARDRRALPVLARLVAEGDWANTVLALRGVDLLDQLFTALSARIKYDDRNLPLAAGYLGRGAALAPLEQAYRDASWKDGYAVGLVFAGIVDDARYKQLSTERLGATAKRLYALYRAPKLAGRRAALDALGKDCAARTGPGGRSRKVPYVPTAALLALCEQLVADEPELVAAAASYLSTYAKARRETQDDAYHLVFLDFAQRAIDRGVAPEVRTALAAVRATIPRAPPFAKAKQVRR